MKITRVLGFKSPKSVPQKLAGKLQDLVTKVDSQILVANRGYSLAELVPQNKNYTDSYLCYTFIDSIKKCAIEVRTGKNSFTLDAETGLILDSKKSLFLSWDKAFKKMEKLTDFLDLHYDDSSTENLKLKVIKPKRRKRVEAFTRYVENNIKQTG